MAADASIRVAVGRVALERRKARYPQTRHHGCFLRVIGAHRAIAEALLSAPHPDRDLARCVLGQLLFVGRAVEDTMQCMLDSDGGCDRGGDAVSSVTFRTWNDLETRHALDKILSRQALSSRLHSEEQRGWVAACDGHDSCGRKLLNSVLTTVSNLAIIGLPQVTGCQERVLPRMPDTTAQVTEGFCSPFSWLQVRCFVKCQVHYSKLLWRTRLGA